MCFNFHLFFLSHLSFIKCYNTNFRSLQRFGDNVGQLMDPNHASMLKSAAASGQPTGSVLILLLSLFPLIFSATSPSIK